MYKSKADKGIQICYVWSHWTSTCCKSACSQALTMYKAYHELQDTMPVLRKHTHGVRRHNLNAEPSNATA